MLSVIPASEPSLSIVFGNCVEFMSLQPRCRARPFPSGKAAEVSLSHSVLFNLSAFPGRGNLLQEVPGGDSGSLGCFVDCG